MAVEPYSQHVEIDRVQNDVDGIYAEQALGEFSFAPILRVVILMEVIAGVMNYADVEPLDGVDMKNGVLAYIALGIDTTTIKNGTTADFSKALFVHHKFDDANLWLDGIDIQQED